MPSVGATGGSSKISAWIKGVQPKGRPGALDRYEDFAVESLPPAPTAAGVRPGAADLLSTCVPAELAVHVTGHTLTGLSALWEYLDCRIGLVMVGSIPLTGWPPLPYGQTGDGPKHPTLRVLVVEGGGGVDMARIEAVIDELFSFHDVSPPMLLHGGHMRPMMHSILATMIMYYEERFIAHEMDTVLSSMRDAYAAKYGKPSDDIHGVFIDWGRRIKKRFDADNLHLTAREGHGELAQVVESLKSLHEINEQQHALLVSMNARVLQSSSRS